MSNSNNQIIFTQLIERHQRVQIPMIQRDYAQGRPSEKEVRTRFLNALHEALILPVADASLPLNLDFIYGSIQSNGDSSFQPLDGQQRLTTLFLLHWYLAWLDNSLEDFQAIFCVGEDTRFSYGVRPSSKEFFDELTRFVPLESPTKVKSVKAFIADQPWYFRYWRLDLTIQSSLTMLDDIHALFRNSEGLFARLCEEQQPAITFQLLDLDHFGLSDDLYIKMNARGKPLTAFETFKARYEQDLVGQYKGESRKINDQSFSIADFVARRMDTAWSDLFWGHRDRSTNFYDDAIMNIFRAVALVTRDPESASYVDDIVLLRDPKNPPSYSEFHGRGWLDRTFTQTIICLLEAWSSHGDGELAALLPDTRYFNEKAVFEKLAANPTSLTFAELVQFAAYASFVRKHEGKLDDQAFQQWMRLAFNLSENTVYNRPVELQRGIAGLNALLAKSADILAGLAAPKTQITGFSQEQIFEEKLKSELIVGHSGWRNLIDDAEGHGYFRGQIGFLLDFSGVRAARELNAVGNWDDDLHALRQQRFVEYFEKARIMFNASGLIEIGDFHWQRALLSIGDYLMPINQNSSFLVNSSTEPDSWKRLLRGIGDGVPAARELLKELWEALNTGSSIKEQLGEMIRNSDIAEKWRSALIQTPDAIAYCEKRVIRRISDDEVYLLKRKMRGGAHVELFGFCFYRNELFPRAEQGKFQSLRLHDYVSVNVVDSEPFISLYFSHGRKTSEIEIVYKNGNFVIDVYDVGRNVSTLLTETLGYAKGGGSHSKEVNSNKLKSALLSLDKELAKLP